MVRLHPVAVGGVAALALSVAAAVKRAPPDFPALPLIATIHDADRRPLWAIRAAPAAHQIAIDCLAAEPAPEGRAYQLWLAAPAGTYSLGLLPGSGRKIIAEIPVLFGRLASAGELVVTLEPARGADLSRPDGPILFRAPLADAG
jgi:anti-sigma-K factor RskA